MTKKMLLSGVALAGLLPHASLAQDVFVLDDIVISANVVPQEINRTGASVEVLSLGELVEGPLTVTDALDFQPGVSFSANGGIGSVATVRVRGLSSQYLGVRIDGIDVADPSAPQTQFDFGGLTTSDLGRIELVKGPQSALYGSEAVAGVVDITTFRGTGEDGVSGQISAEVGSFGFVNGSLGVASRAERGGLAFNISRLTTQGISARAGDDERDGFDQTFLSLTGDYLVTDNVELGFSAFYRDSDIEIDSSSADNSGENFSEQIGARVFASFDLFGGEHTLSYSYFDIERRDPGGFATEFNGDREQIAYLGTFNTDIGILSFGLDRTEESIDNSFEAGSTTIYSVFSELLAPVNDDIDLAASVRLDDNSNFGQNVSGRLAVAWQVAPETTVRAVAGSGFRAPAPVEQFASFGNPDLEVERSYTLELGVEQRFGSRGSIEVTGFYTEIDNLIDFDGAAAFCGSGFGCFVQSTGTTISQGVEVLGSYALTDRIDLFGSYTYTDAETEDVRLVRVPKHDIVLGLSLIHI